VLDRCVSDVGRIAAAERGGGAAELRRRFTPKGAAARLREAPR
jgi:hypothetical protein